MQMKSKQNKIIAIVFMVLGILTLLYFFYTLFISFDYMGNLLKADQIKLGSDFGKMLQYMMSQSFSYLCYALGFLFIAYIVMPVKIKGMKEEIKAKKKEASISEDI